MLISNVAIRRPVFTAMVMTALVVFGWVFYRDLGVDLFPRVEFPVITIVTRLPVTRLIETIDLQFGTFSFRVRIPPEQRGQIRPGAFLQGLVLLDGSSPGAIVPQRAVVRAEGQTFVFVATDGKMSRRAVVLGDALTEAVIIKGGLKAGEILVLGPAGQLHDGAALPAYLAPR